MTAEQICDCVLDLLEVERGRLSADIRKETMSRRMVEILLTRIMDNVQGLKAEHNEVGVEMKKFERWRGKA